MRVCHPDHCMLPDIFAVAPPLGVTVFQKNRKKINRTDALQHCGELEDDTQASIVPHFVLENSFFQLLLHRFD